MKMSDKFKGKVFVTEHGDKMRDIRDSNGQFALCSSIAAGEVVHAINNHDALVEALERLMNADKGEDNKEYVNASNQAYMALQIAKGES